MENSILRQFSCNYKQIIIDEIALEGLEGITFDLLWRRVEKRLSAGITEKMKARFWKFIISHSSLSFYELPEPYPHIEIIDRFTMIDEDTGHLVEPDDYPDGPYEYHPIEQNYGSSKYYMTRKPITTLNKLTYEEAMSKYGETLVVVASIEDRWHALAPHMPITYLYQMLPASFCLLELIGKSRDNGQMSIGKTNLHKIIKDPKTLFYNRKHLQDLDLVNLQNIAQVIKGKGIKCLLIRLKRFHKPEVLSMPKVGIVHNIIQYLLKAPNYCERTELLVKKGVLTQKQNRRLQKTVNIFSFEDRLVPIEAPSLKSKSRKLTQKRRYISLSSKSDGSDASDEETNEPPVKCRYKVGISLMRQAYEQFLEAGLQGLTQVQLSHLLGIEFYTARAICRVFRIRNIVREYLEDKGKQRMARFIAVVATEKMDKKYEEQRNKFLEHLNVSKTESSYSEAAHSSISDDIPLKRIKLEKEMEMAKPTTETGDADVEMTPGDEIIEIKVLDGFENTKTLDNFKKNPTLRQLKFANGVLNVLKEKLCISGYMTLSNLASKEVNEPPMDTKALKSFIQKLVTDEHIKMYKIKWPGLQRYSVLICAHHIKKTDPIIQAKYREICMRAVINKESNTKKEAFENPEPAKVRRSYPRYMKIQKLHEFLMKMTYFDMVKPESHTLPQGFVCVVDLFPEATVELLINNLCTSAAIEIYQIISDSHLGLKLKDTPPYIYNIIMKSKLIQNSVRLNLKVLAMLGLIQLVSHKSAVTNDPGISNSSSFLFYVNRHAKLLDTSGTWPRNKQDVKELSFHFETPGDVTKYWAEVFTISTATEIILPGRGRKSVQSPLRPATDVEKYDTGERFGDGFGPCGFDSCFYMELPRLWQTFYTRANKKVVAKKKPKVPKFEVIKKPKVKPKARRPKKRVVEKTSVSRAPFKQRRRPDASVKFSKREDLLITICKAAITIMSPNSQPGSLIVRNIVAKDLLAINDPRKTKGICHSRATTIDSNITLIHEKQCIINEMRRRRNLVQKYEGLLKKLRLKYSTNMSKFINKARLPMLELIWIILHVMKSQSYTQRLPCVAVSLEDFHNHFTITTSTANKLCNMYKVSDNSPLKEAIMVTVMQTIDSELDSDTAKKIYTTFKAYPESDLRIAVEQLRKCCAIAAKEKLFNNQMRKLDLEDIVQCSYKISVFYKRRWICRLNAEFVEKLAEILFSVQSEKDIKGSAEINCAICELSACGLMEIESTTVPQICDANGVPIGPGEVSALTIDTKYNLKTGTMRWKMKNDVKVSEIYQDTDFSESLEYLSSSSRVHVDEIENYILDMDDEIISYLKQKGERGATYSELEGALKLEIKELSEKLLYLQSKKLIKRVGFYENVIILTKYVTSWSTRIGDEYIICTPWLKLDAGIKLDIFLQWAGITMNAIFEKPGSSIAYIADKLEFVTYRALQDICIFLNKSKCITLKVVKMPTPDLFSDEDIEPQFYDFNPFFAPVDILVFPTKNCLTQYSYVRKRIRQIFAAQLRTRK